MGSNMNGDAIWEYSAFMNSLRMLSQNSSTISLMASYDNVVSPFIMVLISRYFRYWSLSMYCRLLFLTPWSSRYYHCFGCDERIENTQFDTLELININMGMIGICESCADV